MMAAGTANVAVYPNVPLPSRPPQIGEQLVGMFDDIVYSAPCPMCRTDLKGWQSKDGGCSLSQLSAWELWNEARRGEPVHIYTNCDTCGTWVEFILSPGSIAFSDEERAAAMSQAKKQGGGLGEFFKILGHERRGPEPPEEVRLRIEQEAREREEERRRWATIDAELGGT